MSLIDGEPRFASYVALTPVDFAVLDRQNLPRLISEEPAQGIKSLLIRPANNIKLHTSPASPENTF
jgi:CRP-like cAMP-binding protein